MQVDSSGGSAVWIHPIDIHLASQVQRIPVDTHSGSPDEDMC